MCPGLSFSSEEKFSGAGLFVLSRQAEERPCTAILSHETVGANLRFWLCTQYLSPIERRCHTFPDENAYSYWLFCLHSSKQSGFWRVVTVPLKFQDLTPIDFSGILHIFLLHSHFSFFIVLDPLHKVIISSKA